MRFLLSFRWAVSLAVTGSLMVASASSAATVGTLNQLPSPNGCVTEAAVPIDGCATARALAGPSPFFGSHSVAISPNGKQLYAVSFNSNALVTFDRSRSKGRLTQKSGSGGCVVEATAYAGCAVGRGLVKPTSVDISPDGKSVYVASIVGSSVAVFDRNTSTGVLTQKEGTAGCISHEPRPGCAVGRALDGADVVAVSPDNRNVYVGGFTSDSIVTFDRNRSTGAITQKAGPDGCFVDVAIADCRVGRGLNGAEGLTVSPDGKSVYVGAAVGNAIAVFRRNRTTGALIQDPGTRGCAAFQAKYGCAEAHGVVGADSLQVSPDNNNLYAASGVGSSVGIFDRNSSTGEIGQPRGDAACYSNLQQTLGRCVSGIALDGPEGVAVSPDGRTVYIGAFFSGAVDTFDRVTFNGTILQRAGTNGCIVNVALSGCRTGKALGDANGLAISPDGRFVYVGAYSSNAISVFARQQPPSGRTLVSIPARVMVPERGVSSIPVTCYGTPSKRCPGGLTLRAASLTSSSSSVIGRGSFNIARGASKAVQVRLSAAAYRAIDSNGSLKATATMRVVEPTGRIRVFKQNVLLTTVDGRG